MLRDPFEHAALVQRIQSECFAEDIEPPADSLGWTEEELHAFFESGGDELPLRFAETPGVPVRIIPAGVRARVFVISDMHCDHPQNLGWIQQRLPASSSGCFDVCVCCGDVSDNLGVLRQALGVLRARFDEVFFTPGNHELWVRKEPPGTTSLDRIETVRRLCEEKRVRVAPLRLCSAESGSDGCRLDDLLLVPLHSWYHSSWDREPGMEAGGPDGELRKAMPGVGMWTDHQLCKWPPNLANDEARALHFASLNRELVDSLAAALPPTAGRPPPPAWDKRATYAEYGQRPMTDELWTSFDASTFFTPRQGGACAGACAGAGAGAAVVASAASAARPAGRPFTISFSHFVPRQELLPEKRMLIMADLHKVSGSDHLEAQLRQLMPDVHCFGHTHIPMDLTLDGVRYVQWSLGTPREQKGQTRVVFGPMRIYDGSTGGEVPQHWCHWTRHYELYARDLSRTAAAPYLISYLARSKGNGYAARVVG